MIKKIIFLWKQRSFWNLSKKNPEYIFTKVYEENAWGGTPGNFFSGSGSINPNTEIYIKNIIEFIRDNNVSSVVDLGCGDFRIMGRVLNNVKTTYVGLDIVKALIEFNNKQFGNHRIHFQHTNIIEDALPPGDLVLVRQVLQHLSNSEISRILAKIAQYRWALITEHLPVSGDIEHNIDKIHGPHIRMKANSGVFIDQPPFNIKNSRVIFEYREDDPIKGKLVPAVVRTYLITNF